MSPHPDTSRQRPSIGVFLEERRLEGTWRSGWSPESRVLPRKQDGCAQPWRTRGGGATVEWAGWPWGRGAGANPCLHTETCVDSTPQVSPRCMKRENWEGKLYKMLKLSLYVITKTDLYKHVRTRTRTLYLPVMFAEDTPFHINLGLIPVWRVFSGWWFSEMHHYPHHHHHPHHQMRVTWKNRLHPRNPVGSLSSDVEQAGCLRDRRRKGSEGEGMSEFSLSSFFPLSLML